MKFEKDSPEEKLGYIPDVSNWVKLVSKVRYLVVKTWLIIRNLPKAKELFSEPLLTSLKFLIKMEGFNAKFKGGWNYASDDIFEFFDLRCKDYAEFTMNGLRFKHAERGMCEEVFSGTYDWLPVNGKTIVDIGANIGDSSIYFVKKGAKHVFAFEVNPALYGIALDNIHINKMEELITIKNLGIGKGEAQIDPENLGKGGFQIEKGGKGLTIPLCSLEEISKYLVNLLKNSELVLKIDCEGCEYDAILSTSTSTLAIYGSIIGEYHYGFAPIKQKLERAGFKTKFSGPVYNPSIYKNYGGGMVGSFKAWRE